MQLRSRKNSLLRTRLLMVGRVDENLMVKFLELIPEKSISVHQLCCKTGMDHRTIKKYLDGIVAIVATGLNNGRTEGLNGKIRVITRRAYGFHNAQALIGFIFLCCSGVILHPVFKTPVLP